MFESIYVGLSGLIGFSKGLNVLSNNVANLNTPGYKRSQLQFLDLYYQLKSSGGESFAQIGNGVDTGATSLDTSQGDLRQTGNDLDLAIEGTGFFVLRNNGETLYTRAGQFEFDANGFLVERSNQARVAALSGSSSLRDININGLRTNPAKATSSITFNGNLSSSDTQHVISNTSIFDALGGAHNLTLTFDNNSSNVAGSWNVTVNDETGTVATGQILFANGAPVAGSNSISFSYAPAGVSATPITLNFAQDVTSFSAGNDSTLAVNIQDGFAAGALTRATFDADGFLTLTYSNNQTSKRDQIALASFESINELELIGGNTFSNKSGQTPLIGRPNQSLFGNLTAGSIELSNVDLTQQFSDLIITQRGYQASSQVISTANEMIQQLLDIKGRR